MENSSRNMIDIGYGNLQGQLQTQMAQMQAGQQQQQQSQQQQQPSPVPIPALPQAQATPQDIPQTQQQVQQVQENGVMTGQQRRLRDDDDECEVSAEQVMEAMLMDDPPTTTTTTTTTTTSTTTTPTASTVQPNSKRPRIDTTTGQQQQQQQQQQVQIQPVPAPTVMDAQVQQQQQQQQQQAIPVPPPTYLNMGHTQHVTQQTQQQQHPQQQQHHVQHHTPAPVPTPQMHTTNPLPHPNGTSQMTQQQQQQQQLTTNQTTTTDQQFFTTMISTDQNQIAEARRKMNQLLQTQLRAQDELKNAEIALTTAKERVTMAKQQIEMTNTAVNHGTEELTDALLQEPTHWNAMYRKMVEYKDKHGNVDVKRNPLKIEREANPEIVKLGSWVGRVRLEARRPPGHPEHIEPYKVIALNRLGFNWEPRENYWMEKYDELKKYMEIHGKRKMPTRKEPLGVWCDGQVLEYNKFLSGIKPCYITKDRIEMLNEIGFVWDRMGSAWMDSFEELKKYHNGNGHCHVPVNYGDKTLFRWIAKQRKKYKNYKESKKPALTDDQVKLLQEIDFFEPSEERLAKFHAQQEKAAKKEKRVNKTKGRGRPKSKTLIPKEAQVAMDNNAAMSSTSNSASVTSFLYPPTTAMTMPGISMPVPMPVPIPTLPDQLTVPAPAPVPNPALENGETGEKKVKEQQEQELISDEPTPSSTEKHEVQFEEGSLIV